MRETFTSSAVTRRDSCCKIMNEASNSTAKNKKKNNASVRLRISEMGPICKSRKKMADEYDEKGDLAKQFGKEGWPDDNEKCMWLSSGTESPCLSPWLVSHGFILDDSLVSLASKKAGLLWGEAISLFDGSRVDPIEEASLVLERTVSDDLKEEEVVSWLLSSTMNDSSSASSCQQSFEDSASCSNSSFSLDTTLLDSPRLVLDSESERSDSWDLELDHLQTYFPSPCSGKLASDSSCVSSANEDRYKDLQLVYAPEDMDLENFSTEEPLFWPSDRNKVEWNPPFSRDFFVMSPRRNIFEFTNPQGNSPKFIGLQVQNGKMDDRFRNSSQVKRLLARTSKLRNSVKCDPNNDTLEKQILSDEPVDQCSGLLEGDFASGEELPIEKLVGLQEFDGHEGIELTFNRDDFSLAESL